MSRRIPGVAEEDQKDWITKSHRRGPGPRTQRRRERERARRRRSAGFVFTVGMGMAILVIAVAFVGRMIADRRGGPGDAAGPAAPTQETWVISGTIESDRTGEANWIMVFSWDREDSKGFIMYMPRTTLVEIPGFGGGPESIGKALSLGKEPLLISAASNLLGIRFDHHLRLSDQAMRALFDKAGGLELDIEQRLTRKEPDGKVKVIFAEGKQHLDGARIAEYLTLVDEAGDEISRAVRHAAFWSAVLQKFRAEGGAEGFGKFMAGSYDLFTTSAKAPEVEKFFASFASVEAGSVVFETMPVQAQGVDTGTQFYKANAEALQRMVERHLSGSVAAGAGKPGRRIQILNGNGVPGIGQEIGDRLIQKGFKVVLDANAKSFDYDVTQIVAYSDSKEALANAEEIRRALGAGEILVSRQKQSVVDFTVVVGKDYVNKR